MKQIRILCYGDSNTWGYRAPEGDRYPSNIRWTGVLQKELGDNYKIIEEGLTGRTTNFDDPRPGREGKNGKTSLLPVIKEHNPIDIVVLMLGTNDLKIFFDKSPKDIAKGIDELITIIIKEALSQHFKKNTIFLLSPPLVIEDKAKDRFQGAFAKSKQLAKEYEKVSLKHDCQFINTANYLIACEEDGVHLDPISHEKLGKLLAAKIKIVS